MPTYKVEIQRRDDPKIRDWLPVFDVDAMSAARQAEKLFPTYRVIGVVMPVHGAPEPLDTRSTAHVDRGDAMQHGAVNCKCVVKPVAPTISEHDAAYRRWTAAANTLVDAGYTYRGGVRWIPPLGPKPDFPAIDAARKQLSELLAAISPMCAEYEKQNGTDAAYSYAKGVLISRAIQAERDATAIVEAREHRKRMDARMERMGKMTKVLHLVAHRLDTDVEGVLPALVALQRTRTAVHMHIPKDGIGDALREWIAKHGAQS